jgi:hypothetical protein
MALTSKAWEVAPTLRQAGSTFNALPFNCYSIVIQQSSC